MPVSSRSTNALAMSAYSDTTTRAGSVALVHDDHLVEERGGDPSRPLGERLPTDLLDLLASHGLEVSEIDVFAVASGREAMVASRQV